MGYDKSERKVREADPSHVTHLTVDWGRNIKKSEVYNYSHEGCHPRKGVELPNGKDELSNHNHPDARDF